MSVAYLYLLSALLIVVTVVGTRQLGRAQSLRRFGDDEADTPGEPTAG